MTNETERTGELTELSVVQLDDSEDLPLELQPEAERVPARRTVRVLAAATALSFVAAAVFGGLWYRERGTGAAEAVRSVASAFSTHLVSFDHRTLEADIAQTRRLATGTFDKQFSEALGGDITVFRDAIKEAQAQSEAEILAVDVTSVDGDTATAVVTLRQHITNKSAPEGRALLQVLELTLVKTGEGWRVDNVDRLN